MPLLQIESQPNFPNRDVPEAAADYLELLLQNRDVLGQGHKSAESASMFYKQSHKLLDDLALPRFEGYNPAEIEAFEYGISALEAMSAFVRPQFPDGPHTSERHATFSLFSARRTLDLDDYFFSKLSDAKEQLASETPNITRVIGEGALRFYPQNPEYAFYGAGMARMLEIEAQSL